MSDTDDPSGRVAIVTGASRGLGRAMAEGLANAGCYVVAIASRSRAELDSLASLPSGHILPLIADVTDPEDCYNAVSSTVECFGRLDILVNNAGLGMRTIADHFMLKPTKFWQSDINAWRRLIDTNVNGPFLMAREAVPFMLKAGWGRIINISMNYATMCRAGFSPYGPSKAALEAETSIWAQDLAGTGITVNALLPGGATRTGMIPDNTPTHIIETLLDPTIIVPPLLYLASVKSDNVTGQRLNASSWTITGTNTEAGWKGPI
ncbi:SDR family NAD(P)-dependent oxidoreductase [Acidiphilium multivorum]|uniref:SDR family NAD(P)-dependent oxidoreductase n=1 Tax=Acidiphilium multivorum TaxID=62140 RepID=UPI0039C9A6E3